MSSKTIDGVFERLCKGVGSKYSLECLSLYREGKFIELLNHSITASDYDIGDVHRFRDDYLVQEYLSKSEFLATGIDRKQVALDSFAAAETQCKAANERINAYLYHNGSCDWAHVICVAQQKIEACIGSHPKYAKLLNRCRWGKGSTFSLKGEDARLDYKLREGQISVTRQALQHLRAAMATDYAWLRSRGIDACGPTSLLANEFDVVDGSRGATVSKNAKTDRFIAAEPTGNIFLQLGAGGYFRQCLHRVGINLDDQSINQGLAGSALVYGLATVDLKAASDTIPSALVWLLLPYSWASYLESLRSPMIQVEKNWIRLSKFSSMGNGFTFELESLIFWSLTEALRDCMGVAGRVSVYGDDIICPAEMVPQLNELLSWCGFTFNVKKTHSDGLFRESCGKHYFGGFDVTPIYQKVDPDASREEYYRCHNRILYHAVDRGYDDSFAVLADRKFRVVVKFLRQQFRSSFPKGIEHMVPILQREVRELEGGFASDRRALEDTDVAKQAKRMPGGMSVRCQVWGFIPKKLPDADQSALYAVQLRKGCGRSTFTMNRRYRFLYNGGKTVAYCEWELGDLPKHAILADTLTARLQGRYRTKKRYFSQTRDLRWI